MAFVVIYDACVLYPAQLRDLLLRIANTGIVRAVVRADSRRVLPKHQGDRADLSDAALAPRRALVCQAVADCLVTGHEHLVQGLDLPDLDDRHVLAAGIRANAQAIVTFDLKDFPDHVLARHDMETKHPDEFMLDSIDIAPRCGRKVHN